MCLVRDYKSGLLLQEENNNQRKPSTNKAQVKQNLLTTLGTENMVLARPSFGDTGSGTKTKEKSTMNRAGVSQEVGWLVFSHINTHLAKQYCGYCTLNVCLY